MNYSGDEVNGPTNEDIDQGGMLNNKACVSVCTVIILLSYFGSRMATKINLGGKA